MIFTEALRGRQGNSLLSPFGNVQKNYYFVSKFPSSFQYTNEDVWTIIYAD